MSHCFINCDHSIDKVDYNYINNCVNEIIDGCNLIKNNPFFLRAANVEKVDAFAAFKIAYNWREVTKSFLFNTIKGLGNLAEKVQQEKSPSIRLLSVLQTGFSIISDDLNNTHAILKVGAPIGPDGIHYKWWENSILSPIVQLIGFNELNLSSGTTKLLNEMDKLSTKYLGVSVQLRIVETIARDICRSFFLIYSNVEHQGVKIFKTKQELSWITSHITAEEIHQNQVCDSLTGMLSIVTTHDEMNEILLLIQEYSNAWKAIFEDFASYLPAI